MPCCSSPCSGPLPRWFPARPFPLITQLTTTLGQLGQILSAVPFLLLLHLAGWTAAFGLAAASSALVTVLTIAVVRNAPGQGWSPSRSTSVREIGSQLRAVWARPGTRLGFFGHMGTQFSMMTFALLWGVPYGESAQHLSRPAVRVLMTVFVLSTIGIGPIIGLLTARYPVHRSGLLLGIVGADAAIWSAR